MRPAVQLLPSGAYWSVCPLIEWFAGRCAGGSCPPLENAMYKVSTRNLNTHQKTDKKVYKKMIKFLYKIKTVFLLKFW